MKFRYARVGLFAGALLAFSSSVVAQIVEFRASISAAQEVPATSSTGKGSAIVLYNVATNTLDCIVSIESFSNTISASHIHEAAAGVNGPVVTGFGAEALYKRTGNNLTAKFEGLTYGGDPLKLLANGAYVNFHSAAFPGGEIRGQLIAQPKLLTAAIINGAQENPAVNTQAYGAALLTYDPGTNRVTVRVNLFNMANTLTASHIHEAAVGVNGPVKTNFGGEAAYQRVGNYVSATFTSLTHGGDPIKLLTGGAYVNFHTAAYPGGELRGQVYASDELPSTRLYSTSARGFVGTGDQVLINGLAVTGPHPLRVVLTARGPSLTAFGVMGALADPQLILFDSAGRFLLSNDNFATSPNASEFSTVPGIPTNANEAAALVILPPGNYTVVTSGVGATTGVALSEAVEARLPDVVVTTPVVLMQSQRSSAQAAPPEICAAPIKL